MNGVLKDQKLMTTLNLLEAATEGRTPFTLLQLATVTAANTPKLRAVIIRSFNRQKGILSFTADYRSAKIQDIKNNIHVALAGVDNERGIQLRIEGVAEIVEDYAVRNKAWKKLPITSHKLFMSTGAPGTKLSYPENVAPDNIVDKNTSVPVENFCLIHVKIEQIDLLDFYSEPHCRYQYLKIAGEWISYRVTP